MICRPVSWLFFAVVFIACYSSVCSRSSIAHRSNSSYSLSGVFDSMFGLFSREKAFENANDIPSEYFRDKKEIKAVVVKITDGDTFRVRHISSSRPSAEFDGNLKDHTIAIRIAAVDAPETAKFGEEGQKHGEIAKNFVTEKLMGKRVTIKLLARDQYSRVLGLVTYRDNTILPNFLCSKKDISEQLLIHGLAAVYRQGGAQYDGSIDRWNALEQKAIRAKRGIWMNGEKSADLPSAYKKTVKEKTRTKRREFTKV